MIRRPRLATSAALVLAVLAAVLAARIAGHFGAAGVELGRVQLGEPTPALRARLDRLDSELLLSWYGSSRGRMPSDLRQIEDGVMRCLRGIEAAGGGKVRVQRIDPDADHSLAPYLASLGVAPFRARRIERDRYTEESVWSSLRIAYGPHGASTIARVSDSELPHLQDLIAAHLDELSAPRRPRIALSAPRGYSALRRALAQRGDITEIELDADPKLPGDADLCFWIDPVTVDAAHLSALERFVSQGKSVVIAGSRYTATLEGSAGEPTARFTRQGGATDALGAHFGLRTLEGIALDSRSDEGGSSPAGDTPTFLVRAIAPNQDFRTMSSQPNGSLWFAAPTLFEPDAQRLADMDLSCTVLATSSESTWTRPESSDPIPLRELQPKLGTTDFLGARALLAILRPADSWRGSIVFQAASTPFHDDYFTREATAHEPLLEILISSLVSIDRRAAQRVAIAMPARLLDLSPGRRALWRGIVVLGLPLAVALGFLAASSMRRASERREQRIARALALPALGALLLACVLAWLVPARASADLTRAGVHDLAAATRAVLARAAEPGSIHVEFVFSEPARLPPELRARVRRARELVERIEREGTGVTVEWLEPDAGSSADVARLAERGIAPARVTSRADEVTTVRKIFGAIAISRAGAREVLPLADGAAFDELEFKLAYAIERLTTGRRARVAVASDVPRPSPAESMTRYQRQGLFAPGEGDVYSEARDWLESHGFDIAYVDPRQPTIPKDCDVFVWLQPRRDVTPLAREALGFLSRGGKVLIAAQHFHVRSRQEQDRSLALSLWPEPQFPDLDRVYFPAIGIRFPREVLFDASAGTVDAATEVEYAGGAREYERDRAASPLLIRAVAAGFDERSPISRGLGDQLFLFGNRLTWDPAVLATRGLRASALISSSERTWALDWTGGDIPEAVVEGPPDGQYLGRQVLAAQFDGRFPPPAEVDPALASESQAANDSSESRPSQLVWIACSEMFKNGRLHLDGFDHAELLLRATSQLALGDELTSIVAREARERGFEPVDANERAVWRAVVVGAAPILLLVLGAGFVMLRTRGPKKTGG